VRAVRLQRLLGHRWCLAEGRGIAALLQPGVPSGSMRRLEFAIQAVMSSLLLLALLAVLTAQELWCTIQ
jgi:hypothetical protein